MKIKLSFFLDLFALNAKLRMLRQWLQILLLHTLFQVKRETSFYVPAFNHCFVKHNLPACHKSPTKVIISCAQYWMFTFNFH